jgi:hypothetical protein
MSPRRRQHLMTVVAVLAVVAMSAKIIKAIWRGETTQSRVRQVN